MQNQLNINLDSFANGQIGSKIWLCEQLESLIEKENKKSIVWILGSWYGVLAFLLLSRKRELYEHIYCFDISAESNQVCHKVNDFWRWKYNLVSTVEQDVNQLHVNQFPKPDIIINTSSEHMSKDDWWESIDSGTRVVIQSCNMPHPEHIACVNSENELIEKYNMSLVEYSGSLEFDYKNPTSFTRYMTIGIK